jgi:hypothetical protein
MTHKMTTLSLAIAGLLLAAGSAMAQTVDASVTVGADAGGVLGTVTGILGTVTGALGGLLGGVL